MRISLLLGTRVLAALWGQARGQQDGPAAEVEQRRFNIWMQVKLKESQEIFAAVAVADYDTICESVDELRLLNTVEGFVRNRNPEYRAQLRAFEYAIDEVRRHAVKENIEGVTLGFHQLTLSCVNCHKQLRDREKQLTRQPRESPP